MVLRKQLMYILAGLVCLLFLAGFICLLCTIDDWSRDLITNYASTSPTAKNSHLRPIEANLPPVDFAGLIATAASQIPGWQLVSREESSAEITLHFVRTTRLLRFQDDITVRIRPKDSLSGPTSCEVSAESKSRIGKGDFGQNPRNLRELMDKIRSLLP